MFVRITKRQFTIFLFGCVAGLICLLEGAGFWNSLEIGLLVMAATGILSQEAGA